MKSWHREGTVHSSFCAFNERFSSFLKSSWQWVTYSEHTWYMYYDLCVYGDRIQNPQLEHHFLFWQEGKKPMEKYRVIHIHFGSAFMKCLPLTLWSKSITDLDNSHLILAFVLGFGANGFNLLCLVIFFSSFARSQQSSLFFRIIVSYVICHLWYFSYCWIGFAFLFYYFSIPFLSVPFSHLI